MKQYIRNSTAEFLMFTAQAGENSIEVRVEDESVWLSQKLIAELFGVTLPTVNEHLKNIYNDAEIDRAATIQKFRIVQSESELEQYRIIQDRLLKLTPP
jgi:hypothetical protein